MCHLLLVISAYVTVTVLLLLLPHPTAAASVVDDTAKVCLQYFLSSIRNIFENESIVSPTWKYKVETSLPFNLFLLSSATLEKRVILSLTKALLHDLFI